MHRDYLAKSEGSGAPGITLQNDRMAKVVLAGGDVMARQGAMVAYQGAVEFAYEGAGGVKRLLKKALSGQGVPLMRCSGTGDLFLAQHGHELHVLPMSDDSLTVNGADVVAFDSTLSWDVTRVEGVTVLAGDVFTLTLSGTGSVVVAALGTPVLLDAAAAPTFADVQSAIAWSSSLRTKVVRTARAAALIGRGSGEAVQLAFEGEGFVLVQASEGPFVPKHDHTSITDWL